MAGIPTPDKWSNYCVARTLHGVIINERPISIYQGLASQALHETRSGKTYFFVLTSVKLEQMLSKTESSSLAKDLAMSTGYLTGNTLNPLLKKSS